MTSGIRSAVAALALVAAFASVAPAQGLLSQIKQAAAPAPSAPAVPADPYGRQTPAGTVMGFLAAGSHGDWVRAAHYLDTKQPEARAEELARELKVLLDRGLSIDLNRLSHKPEGEQDERVPRDHELIGSIDTETGRLDILLVRVHYGGQAPYWLFSAGTLRAVPSAYQDYKPSFIEAFLPAAIVRGYGEQYRLWSWAVMFVLGVLAFVVALALARLGTLLVRLVLKRLPGGWGTTSVRPLLAPMRWLIFGLTLRVMSDDLLTLRQRYLGGRAATLLVVASAAWLGVTVVAASIGRWARALEYRGTTERIALVRLGGRLLQAVAIVVGILAVLRAIGINLTPVLAGLGVGGIAVALASQKTLENLFGGMMVIGDSPIRVGNFCRVGTLMGTVEDIGLRSTRIRTLGRTMVSIPNAELASQSIENFALRDKLLFNPVLSVRYETTAEQLRYVLAEIRALLYRHERIETASARVRFVRCGQSGLDLEIFAYVSVADYDQFLAIQEDLLLRLMDIVEAAGTGLAFPSQTLYLAKDGGTDADKSARAVEAVREWRERGELPFPDVTPEQKAGLHGTVAYPPDESVLRKPRPKA